MRNVRKPQKKRFETGPETSRKEQDSKAYSLVDYDSLSTTTADQCNFRYKN